MVLTIALFSDRLVESSRIKRALEAVYSGVLPKGASPFVYLRYFSLSNSGSQAEDVCRLPQLAN